MLLVRLLLIGPNLTSRSHFHGRDLNHESHFALDRVLARYSQDFSRRYEIRALGKFSKANTKNLFVMF